MGFRKKITVVFVVFLYPFVCSYAKTQIYECLNDFHDNYSKVYNKSSYKSYVRGHRIKKRRSRNGQNVIVADLVDPVDDKRKKLLATRNKAVVCDPQAEEGELKCKGPEERHLNASIGKHISILPDVYRDSLTQFLDNQLDDETEIYKRPEEVINGLNSCAQVSKKLRRRIMNKSRALTSIHSRIFNGPLVESINTDSTSTSGSKE